jgi:hypothetical protein
MMAQAGYNPIEMARFFEKLEAQGGGRAPQFLSSHPNPGDRVRLVQEEIQYLPRRSYGGETGGFQRAQSLVGGLPAPQRTGHDVSPHDPRSGGPMPDIRASGRLREYSAQSFSISYPENWEVFGDQNSSMVTIAPREALFQGAGGGTSVGYGVMASYYFPEANRVNLRRDTDALISRLLAENPGAQVQESQRTRISGQAAVVTTLVAQSPYRGETEVDRVITVARPEGLFYAVFIAPRSEWNDVQDTFNRMLNSIRFR